MDIILPELKVSLIVFYSFFNLILGNNQNINSVSSTQYNFKKYNLCNHKLYKEINTKKIKLYFSNYIDTDQSKIDTCKEFIERKSIIKYVLKNYRLIGCYEVSDIEIYNKILYIIFISIIRRDIILSNFECEYINAILHNCKVDNDPTINKVKFAIQFNKLYLQNKLLADILIDIFSNNKNSYEIRKIAIHYFIYTYKPSKNNYITDLEYRLFPIYDSLEIELLKYKHNYYLKNIYNEYDENDDHTTKISAHSIVLSDNTFLHKRKDLLTSNIMYLDEKFTYEVLIYKFSDNFINLEITKLLEQIQINNRNYRKNLNIYFTDKMDDYDKNRYFSINDKFKIIACNYYYFKETVIDHRFNINYVSWEL